MMNNIEKEMNRLVSLDLPINRLTVSKEEAIQLYEKLGYKDFTFKMWISEDAFQKNGLSFYTKVNVYGTKI